MSGANEIPLTESPGARRARQLRAVAVTVLVLGIVGVGVAYWIAPASPDTSDDIATAEYYKSTARQVEVISGKEGLLVDEWSHDLQRPGPQSCIIIGAAVLIAGGCFYFARLLEFDEDKKN
jgi:hypothetical protein